MVRLTGSLSIECGGFTDHDLFGAILIDTTGPERLR